MSEISLFLLSETSFCSTVCFLFQNENLSPWPVRPICTCAEVGSEEGFPRELVVLHVGMEERQGAGTCFPTGQGVFFPFQWQWTIPLSLSLCADPVLLSGCRWASRLTVCLGNLNDAAVSTGAKSLWMCIFLSFRSMPESGFTGSCGMPMFVFRGPSYHSPKLLCQFMLPSSKYPRSFPHPQWLIPVSSSHSQGMRDVSLWFGFHFSSNGNEECLWTGSHSAFSGQCLLRTLVHCFKLSLCS